MATQQKLSTKSVDWPPFLARLGRSRPGGAGLVHLVGMETTTQPETGLGPVLTLSQLATQLGVTVQTLYDLRSQGRGAECEHLPGTHGGTEQDLDVGPRRQEHTA